MTNPHAVAPRKTSPFMRLVDDLALVLFAALIIVATMQVFFRYVLVAPLPWTEELARFLLVWVTFLGAASITRRKMHIRVDFFAARFSAKVQTLFRLGIYLMSFFFLCVVFWGTIVMMIDAWPVHAGTMPWLSMSFVYLGAGIGEVLMLGFVVAHLGSASVDVVRMRWSVNDPME